MSRNHCRSSEGRCWAIIIERLEERIVLDGSEWYDGNYHFLYYDDNHFFCEDTTTGEWYYYDNLNSQIWEPFGQWFTDSSGASSFNDWDCSHYFWDANHYLAQDHNAGAWIYYDNLNSQTWEPYGQWFTDMAGATSCNLWDYSYYWWDANHYLAQDHNAGAWIYYDNVGSQSWEPYQDWFTDSSGATSYNDWAGSYYNWDTFHQFWTDHATGQWYYFDNVVSQAWEPFCMWFHDSATGMLAYNDWDSTWYRNWDMGESGIFWQDHQSADAGWFWYDGDHLMGSSSQLWYYLDGGAWDPAFTWFYDSGAGKYVYHDATLSKFDSTAGDSTYDYWVDHRVTIINGETYRGLHMVGIHSYTGTAGNDLIYGTSEKDVIIGGAGDDVIFGCGGEWDGWGDYLYGDFADSTTGTGNDIIYGGDANEHIFGDSESGDGYGNDIIYGGNGRDIIYGDSATGCGYGNDLIYGGADVDHIYGDSFSYPWGPDGYGNDLIYGEDGDDYIYGDTAYNAGHGDDTIYGGNGDDKIYGDYSTGSDGNDTIYGGLGADTISGSGGNDTLYHGREQDGSSPDGSADTLYGGGGIDTVYLDTAEGDTYTP